MSSVRSETIDKHVRGWLGDAVLVETRGPLLVWQGDLPPVYGFATDEIAKGALRPVAPPGDGYPGEWFFGPHLPVAEWFDVVSSDETVPFGAWRLADLPERVVLTWEPGRLSWTEEDEPVGLHPRDPHKRVETLHSSRHVEVSIDGQALATSERPVLLLETDLPTRYYLPADDVRLDRLVAATTTTACPYKGAADRYWTWPGPPEVTDVAWSYSSPLPAVAPIAHRVCFYNERVDLRVDGVLLDRPDSPFA